MRIVKLLSAALVCTSLVGFAACSPTQESNGNSNAKPTVAGNPVLNKLVASAIEESAPQHPSTTNIAFVGLDGSRTKYAHTEVAEKALWDALYNVKGYRPILPRVMDEAKSASGAAPGNTTEESVNALVKNLSERNLQPSILVTARMIDAPDMHKIFVTSVNLETNKSSTKSAPLK